MPINYLITYTPLKGHKDPDFKQLIYGDSGTRGENLKNKLSKGSYLFFHTKIGSEKYITCYIVIDKVISSKRAQADPVITCDAQFDDWVFIGDKCLSKRLRKPLPFNKALADKLSININFDDLVGNKRTQVQIIGSATRSQRELNVNDVNTLLDEISKRESNSKVENTNEVQYHLYFYDEGEEIIPFDEVHQVKENEIQKLILKCPQIIEEGIKVIDYEKVLPDGDRLDLLLEDLNGNLIVAELKGPDCLSDSIPTQIASYIRDIEREFPGRHIRKMIICDGKVSPRLQKACESLGIEIVVYGLKLDCFKLK